VLVLSGDSDNGDEGKMTYIALAGSEDEDEPRPLPAVITTFSATDETRRSVSPLHFDLNLTPKPETGSSAPRAQGSPMDFDLQTVLMSPESLADDSDGFQLFSD
jgi:hypothetical protein